MFEGLVRQLILGYLGLYIKDIQKEQLKITLWNEEVLLENVELILEAFDYLRLPLVLKQGRIGKLSIKIPWKKLGWDPVIIILEDIYICVSQREDKDWCMDAVERREFASKKAQLAAAELAKLSRRVCDNQTGKSFNSYITAKILDSIQLSIRNVHVLYRDSLTAREEVLFGLKFSSLTIMKQIVNGSAAAVKVKSGQVNKWIEIQGLELYCGTFQGNDDLSRPIVVDSKNNEGESFDAHKCSSMLAPLNVSLSLSVKRSGKLVKDAPQYAINIELSSMAISMNEVQLQQILSIYDYLSLCRLREIYGRYRPWWFPLEKRLEGWQRAWWWYAQESVLSDIRKKLRKTSWKYFGERLNTRRKYVNLYKTKLKSLRHDEVIEVDVLHELEDLEKETDIGDILNYRSVAERELEDFLVNSSSSHRINGGNIDKSIEDDHPSNKSRGWLNWLSYGMLGAGGTDDSSQFSGVISDDVIKDIYEATKFHPSSMLLGDFSLMDEVYFSSVKINISEICTTLQSMELGRSIANLILEDISIKAKVWEKSATITASINSAKMLNPLNSQLILLTKKVNYGDNVLEKQHPTLNIKVDCSPPTSDIDLLVKIILNPTELYCDSKFMKNIVEFFHDLQHFIFQHQRILLSLNGIGDLKTRLLSKIDYILSSRKKTVWDAKIFNPVIVMPWENAHIEEYNKIVLEAGSVSFVSRAETEFFGFHEGNQFHLLNEIMNSGVGPTKDILIGFQLQDLYDFFEIQITDMQMKLLTPSATVPLFEKFNASTSLASCILLDEPVLKTLEICVRVPSVTAHFSALTCGTILGLVEQFKLPHPSSDSTVSLDPRSNGQDISIYFGWLSINASLGFINLLVNLEDDVPDGCTMKLLCHMLDVRYDQRDFTECWVFVKACRITTRLMTDDCETNILCSAGSMEGCDSVSPNNLGVSLDGQIGRLVDQSSVVDGCIVLHCEAHRNEHRYSISSSDLEIHCHPFFVGRLIGFMEKITVSETPIEDRTPDPKDANVSSSQNSNLRHSGVSNAYDSSFEPALISLNRSPLHTIDNLRPLSNLENRADGVWPKMSTVLCLEDQKNGDPKLSVTGEAKLLSAPLINRGHDADCSPLTSVVDLLLVTLNLGSVTVHFHDSSCIVGTIMVPLAKSVIHISADFLDIVCSTDGMTLSSIWCSQLINEFLWGPLSPDLSPILNLHLNKGNVSAQNSQLELSFNIQKVSCMLPPEFLAIVIGYFSLPDWSSYANKQPAVDTSCENPCTITYKFEIVNCNVLTPSNGDYSEFLKVNISQLCTIFSENCAGSSATRDIPSASCISASKFADRNNCLDFYGCDLFLTLLILESDIDNSSSRYRTATLIAPLSADVWIRIPQNNEISDFTSSYPICIMAMVNNCQLDVEEVCAISGIKGLGYVFDQFSLVGEESQIFSSDVPHFLRTKKQIHETATFFSEASSTTLNEMRFCVRSLSLRLHQLKNVLPCSELMAEAEMEFVCSISLENGRLYFLDISFSSLALFSLVNCVMLAKCSCPGFDSSVLDLIISMSDGSENHLVVSLPCLNVWLYWFDWIEIIDLLQLYNEQLAKVFKSSALTEIVTDIPSDAHKYVFGDGSNHDASPNMNKISGFPSVTLDHIGLEFHFPARVNTAAYNSFIRPYIHSKQTLDNHLRLLSEIQNCFLSISLQSRSIEVAVNGKTVILTMSSGNLSGMLRLFVDDNEQTWPLFLLSKIQIEAEISEYGMENVIIKMVVLCDNVDFSLSNKILYLSYFAWFQRSEEMSPQSIFKKMNIQVQLRKVSVLLTDWKTSSGPLLEFLVRNFTFWSNVTEDETEGSVMCELQVNYYNIDKVLWEPFVEPWSFRLSVIRKHDESALFNNAIMTDISLESKAHLNLNINETLIEVILRALEMIKDAWGLIEMTESRELSNSQIRKNPETARYAPYKLQNLTSLPLVFYVCQWQLGAYELDVSPSEGVLQPGSSVLVYINESPEKLLLRGRPTQSSDRLNDNQSLEAAQRYVIFQLEGTSMPSMPISMDLVGRRYFDLDFSKSSHSEINGDANTMKKNVPTDMGTDAVRGFVIPVVVDVSVQHYTKLMRLYSTVVILNATSVSLELRFDIPLGVSPKILGPIYPGQEFPLPLHLAEAGCIRWRPLGDMYLWSESYNISSIISQDVRIGFSRSFVCYPSHPSCEAFRCCISVHDQSLHPIGKLKRVCSSMDLVCGHRSLNYLSQSMINLERPKNRFLYQVMLTSPLVLKNYLMKSMSLTLENAGVKRNAILSEVETSLFHIDSSHDLSLTFKMRGFRPSVLKLPRAESFSTMSRFGGTKFSLSEVIRFDPEFSDGPLYVTMEKMIDTFSGAREILISVPFLLYNCTGFSLALSNSVGETNGYSCIPSCYNLDEQRMLVKKKDGLGLICPSQELPATGSTCEPNSSIPDFVGSDCMKVNAYLFSPDPNSYSGDILVKLGRCFPPVQDGYPKSSWSAPFSLVPPAGSTDVLVPQPFSTSGYVISVCAVAAPFSGRTKIITFQPRYVIANACTKNLCYKQKGTNFPFILEAGQHSHIQWIDTTRELLLSVRFDDPGWEWSGCFRPEQLGETQVKVRNYMTTAARMIRVVVRRADVSVGEETIVGSLSGNSDTNLILLSDDGSGFMPYRIDNISRERLRVYQPKCESFETVIHPYTSCPFAWDEPCYPHILNVEVPGERILGSFAIDEPSPESHVYLPTTLEKPERNLLISVHSEGAIKVLSIIDSNYHVLNDLKNLHVPPLKDNRKQTQKDGSSIVYKEKLSVDIPFIGISLMNSHPEEILFASAKNTTVSFVQSLDQQQFSLQIASLQIDNQLHSTPYPVILSFNHGNRINIVNHLKSKGNSTNLIGGKIGQTISTNLNEPVFLLTVAKWRNSDTSLVSFESISLRISNFYLQIELEIGLRLFEFFKTVSSRLQTRVFQPVDSFLHQLIPDSVLTGDTSGRTQFSLRLHEKHLTSTSSSLLNKKHTSYLLPHMVPIGAPWQKIHLSDQTQKKIYVEHFDMAPIKLTLSFSSSPRMLRNGVLMSGDSFIHRGLMALADVEGAKIHFKQLILSHQLASWESIQEILVSHYTRQFLHEMYKVFGSAGVIGNPLGFARSLGLGIRDFFSLPIWSVFQSPAGLITGMAQGTTSLVSNTVYAISDATTQFSKAAHKGIVAFTFDDQPGTMMEKQQRGVSSQNKGVINEFLQGLTGVLQSPIEGAEKHGLPGVLSGIAVGVTGLVARPAASILEVTGKTAQSIRNRSRIHQMGYQCFRLRLPRPLSRELPLKPYSWEDAVGTHVLLSQREDETLVMCKSLKQCGKYALITEKLILVFSCSSLIDLGKPEFEGVPADPSWVMQSEIRLDSVILADNDREVVHIVGSDSDASFSKNQNQQQKRRNGGAKGKLWNNFHTPLPLFQTNLEFMSPEDADEFLKVLMSIIERGKERGWSSVHILHQSNIK
ncbi:intermembrane lipid transfer protein VPS13 isoform X2 [Primulina eburnea]|uniref:intermembrane lipid transfer protein VPS13 isoform X2 n=1 Tax=Primulina eburnea TaxID=1245227 RepID=UPI003C6C06A7